MEIFQFESYKGFLKHIIEKNKTIRAYQGKVAEAAGCQRSYLSQILHREVNFTADQAFGVCEFLNLSEDETRFFLLLLQKERSGKAKYQNFLESQLKQMRDRNSKFSYIIKGQEETNFLDRHRDRYYSHWSYLAVHMAVVVKQVATSFTIADFLALRESRVHKILIELQEMDLVELVDGKWKAQVDHLSLKDDDRNLRGHLLNWRMKAIDNLATYDSQTDTHYTAVYSLSKNEALQLKSMIQKWVLEIRKTAIDSKATSCFNLNIDFYNIN